MPKNTLNSDTLRSRLKLKNFQSEALLKTNHPQAFFQLRSHAARLLTAGAAASTLILTPGQTSPIIASLPAQSEVSPQSPVDLHSSLIASLSPLLPPQISPLTSAQETQISQLLHDSLGIHATAELEGNRLNHSYGIIGAEQHLPRYPGDTVAAHVNYLRSGITPGRGAWGYFAPSASALTPDLVEKEKYYVAVQTLYLSDWQIRLPYLRDWFKYRKVAVVNPANGRVIVAVVADSGPAAWTGKHYGGSPEVMAYLGLNIGRQAGKVVLFFVDDPQDSVPLGPLEFNLEKPPLLLPG